MDLSLLILAVINFTLVCVLPFIFFRNDGKFNIMWCLTASPYTIFPIILILGHLGMIDPITINPEILAATQIIAIPMFIGSIIIMSLTLGTHRVPLALWHQDNDAPKSIITFGAYAKFRHPFYTSFILSLLAGMIIFPHALTIATTVIAITLLTLTAKKEERKLSASEFGNEYKEYMTNTGRFFPRLSSLLGA